eukprot:10901104-Alexandrium_andersonii.AAC.1
MCSSCGGPGAQVGDVPMRLPRVVHFLAHPAVSALELHCAGSGRPPGLGARWAAIPGGDRPAGGRWTALEGPGRAAV